MKKEDLAKLIDHTSLRETATEEEIRRTCEEALEYRFKTVCIRSQWLPLAVEMLAGTEVLPITVIGFPTGSETTDEKLTQTEKALELGAAEIDMVLNREWLKHQDYQHCFWEIYQIAQVCKDKALKVILETSELSEIEIIEACTLAKAAGASFVKTSTGFSSHGATVEAVEIMRKTVGPELGVKASGGIRSYEDAMKMVQAGATRLGTSASVAIVVGAIGKEDY